ncbi:MAG: hypothetical protein ACOH12_16695 [Parvibaculaceae bacterium]
MHYVWCSPKFDTKTTGRYETGASTPASSDPCRIYREFKDASHGDDHSAKVAEQKVNLAALAVQLEVDGKIDTNSRDEIAELIRRSNYSDWRPLLYIIPSTEKLKDRVKLVPREQRASHEFEYIISDLQRDEFDVIEFANDT